MSSNSTYDPYMDSQYGYTPSESIAILFVVLFSVSTVVHIAEATKFRLWWLFPTVVLAGFGEIIGWVGRLWSSRNPNALNPFLMQITTTIIAPTPLVAANFIILGAVIRHLGVQYSRLTPRQYAIVFCTADLVALIVQAIGGASASSAASNNEDASKGGHIMLAGIVFQLIAITIYVALATEFLVRYLRDRPLQKYKFTAKQPDLLMTRVKLLIFGLSFSTLCLFIRSVYRTIELANGWGGRIITTQVYFNVLDGAMIVLAMYTLNFFHPGFLLQGIIDVKKNALGDESGVQSLTEVNKVEKI